MDSLHSSDALLNDNKDRSQFLSIPPEIVRDQLARILEAPDFVKAEKLSNFLRFVVEETLDGRAEHIKQYTVAVRALGRNTEFDPQTNPIVRITATRLRKTLTRYYGTLGARDAVCIDIPKGGYVPIFRSNLLKKRDHLPPTITTKPQAPSQLTLLKGPAIVVLPFDCSHDEQELHYLATGLAEQLVVTFSRFPEYLIIGPLSPFAEGFSHQDIRAVGQEYQAQFVLSGSLRQQGKQLRLTVKLTDVVTGGAVWAETYDNDGNLAELFAFEDEVVNQITAVLGDNLGVIPRSLTHIAMKRNVEDTAVYDAILRYYHYNTVFTRESRVAALEALERAILKTPDFPITLAMLADMYYLEHQLFAADDKTLTKSRQLAQRALTIDPQCQHGRFVAALIHLNRNEPKIFAKKVERALTLNPNNANLLYIGSVYLAISGEWLLAKDWLKRARQLNPYFPSYIHLISYLEAYHQGEFRAALAAARRVNLPDIYLDPLIRAAAFGQLGRIEEGQTAVSELLALQPDFVENGRRRMYRLFFSDKNVQALTNGLAKAGLPLD